MEQEQTPHKMRFRMLFGEVAKHGFEGEHHPPSAGTTPSGKWNSSKKPLHPRTPNKCHTSSSMTTTSSSCSSSSIHVFSASVVNTPPAKRFQRVRNPFEPLLAERLHLPLIASPSLFQRPTTPQLSSTQFEWTIDEVSSLKPAHVEPHETQFHDSPDPDYEAKAQSAISSYFKDNLIVPSPVDCPLRNHRIILSELNSNTPITKPRRIRDCGIQTMLTLPPVLPQALEDALKPYFQPHLALPERPKATESMELRFSTDSHCGTDAKDTSLRRKLFDMHNIAVLDNESRTPSNSKMCGNTSSSPTASSQHIAIVGKLSDSLDKSSFGSLSPISATDCLSISPHSPRANSAEKLKSHLQHVLHELDAEQLSPIHPPTQNSRKSLKNSLNALVHKERYRCELNNTEPTMEGTPEAGKFTPDRSSSPLHALRGSSECVEQHSIDSSFNFKVSRLVVNSSKCATGGKSRMGMEAEIYAHDDTYEMLEEDDDMQVSQLSTQSFNCSSNSSDTPRSKRRSASRKNLSQSFSLNWLEDEDEEQQQEQARVVPKIEICSTETVTMTAKAPVLSNEEEKLAPRVAFYRTDSGFNEMPTSSSSSCSHINTTISSSSMEHQQQISAQMEDVSMVCCSTPSKRTQPVTVNS